MSTKKLAYGALAAALIFAITAFIRVPVPIVTGGAYVNLGDAVIVLFSVLLGGPIAAIAAAIGSGLADFAAGAPIYAPATFLIKGLMGFIAGAIAYNRSSKRLILAAVICGAVMILGYGLYELAVFGAAYALTSLPFNFIQWGGSIVVVFALSPIVKNVRIKY
jgi:uncharacterized membrane protein